MTIKILAITGVPMSGKTTHIKQLMTSLYGQAAWKAWPKPPVPHMTSADGKVVVLGHYFTQSATFEGTDKLAFSAVTQIKDWLLSLNSEEGPVREVWFGGDRLVSLKFFQWIEQRTERFQLKVHVLPDPDEETLKARKEARPDWNPSAPWLKGRVTKVSNLRKLFPDAS